MNAESTVTTTESAPTSATPGTRIREVRERLGISQARLGEQIRLHKRVIEALEEDRYEDIAAPLFVRGYLRNVAKALNIDERTLVSGYDQFLTVESTPELTRVSQPADDGGLDRNIIRFGAVAVALVTLGLAVMWWQGQTPPPIADTTPAETLPSDMAGDSDGTGLAGNSDMPPGLALRPGIVQRPPAAPAPVRAQPSIDSLDDVTLGFAPGTDSQPPALTEAPDAEAESGDAGFASADATDDALAEAPTASPDTAADADANADAEGARTPPTIEGASGAPLVLEARRDAWIEVSDAGGRRLFYNIARADERVELSGEPPFKMVIGNAAYVSVWLDGAPVDLANVSEQGVARLSVGVAQPSAPDDFE